MNRPQVLLADEPTGNLDPATSVDIMQLLARINAGGTTVVMATHEAGFVDQMQRRVIELRHGEMVRDERHGGYGDTSGLPSLAPEPERGAAAVAALTAVLEVQREAAAAIDPTLEPIDLAPRIRGRRAARRGRDSGCLAPRRPRAGDRSSEPNARRPRHPTPSRSPSPIAAEVDVAELGLADRLGLGETDPDDEVGPTS